MKKFIKRTAPFIIFGFLNGAFYEAMGVSLWVSLFSAVVGCFGILIVVESLEHSRRRKSNENCDCLPNLTF